MSEKIQIKLKAFDAAKLEAATKKIIGIAKAEGAEISGPVPLPTKRELFTILRSTHIYKTSREQFEIKTHKRLIVLTNVSGKLKETLKHLKLSAGVSIELKQK